MPIVPLYGHESLRRRLRENVGRDSLPSSLLFHGARGTGKQRLALWLGQLLLCSGAGDRPCGACQSCRYASELAHPDLHWFFPRPRLRDADASAEEVEEDYAEARAERLRAGGLYAAPSGTEAIFVSTVRTLVRKAAMSPAMGPRKVFVVGDAERMVPQEGAEAAANAFLKLLEEPPANTVLLLTSSEPGALLPTIRSRVVAVRVPLLRETDVKAMLSDPLVRAALDSENLPASPDERVRLAAGAPGTLLSGRVHAEAMSEARRLLEVAASGDRAAGYRLAMSQGGSKARGAFSETLDALTAVLHERARKATVGGEERLALASARAVGVVEKAKGLASGNVSPQLIGASLVRDLSRLLR